MRECKHEGCPRPPRGRGYCGTHYQQWRTRGTTWDIKDNGLRKSDEEFIRREAKRLADIERRRVEREARRDKGPCKVDGCTEKANVAKTRECSGHYQQRLNGRPYSELQRWSDKQDKFAVQRKCNGCQRIKNTEEGFYKRANGITPQNQCKKCMGFRNRYRYLIREGRDAEANSVKQEWDEYVAEGIAEAQNRA